MTIERMIELLEAEELRHRALAKAAEDLSLFHAHEEVCEALLLAVTIAKGGLQ